MTGQAAVGADIRDRRVNAVIAFAVVAAVALTITGWLYDGPPHDYVALAVLTVLTLVTRLVRVRVVERVAVAASGIVSLASCVLVGPVGSAVMLVLAILIERGSIRWPARIFNAALGAILGSVGGIVYLVLGGPRNLTSVSGPGEVLWHVGVPFFAASLAFSLVNFGSIALIVRVDSGASFRSMFFAMLTTSGLAQIGYGVVGLLFVILWVPAQVGPFSALLILIPLFVAQWAFVQYAEEERAHERTLAALVAAGETRDPYAVGHSERVARLSVLLAEGMGLGPAQIESLRYAAMLHDIGWLGARASGADQGDVPKTSDRDLVLGHPGVGATLLDDISFLQDSLEGIKHHHERWDGRGYPSRLAGDAIPLASRIIAVADALDSVTRGRPGHDAPPIVSAVQDLQLRAGSHLDPAVVAALVRVGESSPSQLGEALGLGSPDGPPWDHDDPSVSDLLAGLEPSTRSGQRG